MGHPFCTLGEVPLELTRSSPPPGWIVTAGTSPYFREIEVHEDTAAELMALAGDPLTFYMAPTSADGEALIVERLYVLRSYQGTHPEKRRVVFADQRVWWPHVHVERDYNLRRITGDTFLEGDNFAAAAIEPREAYAPWSLLIDQPVGAVEALIDVLSWVTFETGSSFIVEDQPPERTLEELRLKDQGDAAIARVLREFPGVNVYPHPDGFIRVYDTHSRTLEAFGELTDFHWPAPNSGSVDVPAIADRRGDRAASVRVFFGCRHEMLVSGKDGSRSTTLGASADSFNAINVAPSPDRFLENVSSRLNPDGQLAERTVAQLALCEFGTKDASGLLRAWFDDYANNPWITDADDPESGVEALTQQVIREGRAAGLGYTWEYFVKARATNNAVWLARFQAILAHWRWSWAIDPYWWGKLEGFIPRRLGVSNRVLGQGVRSPVYMDHTLRPTRLGENRSVGNVLQGELQHGAVIKALTNDPTSPDAGPFVVVPLNLEAGAFSIRPVGDPTGERDQVLPGTPLNDLLPTKQLGRWNASPDEYLAIWDDIELTSSWEVQTILSIIPGAPNDESRLHFEEVAPADVVELLGSEVGECRAPRVDIYVPDNLMPADFAWNDAQSLKGTLENGERPDPGFMVNQESVRNLALAIAAAYYDPLLDRPLTDGAEKQLSPTTVPAGGVSQVEHGVDFRGRTTTKVVALELPRAGNYWRYLDDSTRKVILRSLARDPAEIMSVF